MKKLILITVLSLTSSCGLFRKTVKSSNYSEQVSKVEVKAELKEQITAVVDGENRVVSNEQKQVQKDIDENSTLTADEIEVKPDGSTKGKGNAKLVNNRKDKSKTNQNKAINRTDSYVVHIDATKENKDQGKQENKFQVKNTQSQSEPKGSMMIWIALGGLLFVIGLILFLRRK